MRGMKMLAVGAMLVAGAASAQETESTSAGTDGRWSVGAGAGLTAVGNNPVADEEGLTPRASLEYLLSDDTALVLGVFGNFGVSWAGGGGSELDGGLGANLGLRKYLTGAGPTRLSLHGVFNAGFRDEEGSASTMDFGVSGGFAVDRELIQNLTLRAGVELANFGYTRREGVNRIGLNLFIAPSLELRLAF
jgi:opacity protein-like surface antigen